MMGGYTWLPNAPHSLRGGLLLCALALGPAVPLRADTIYKSTDADGHVIYSDHPDTASTQTVLNVDRPDPKEVARNVKDQQILKAEDAQRRSQQSAAEQRQSLQEHARQVQCDAARNRYYALKDARRIFQRDADGNRVYYSDTDADAKREEARQAMTTACAT